jgi:hypothetical protein
MKSLLASLAIVLVAGCASYSGAGLKPGVDSEARVRAVMGEPAMKLANADGTALWAYPRGPQGYDTFMARIASSGQLVSIDQVLDAKHFNAIVPGLGKEEVLRIIGPPRLEQPFPRQDELAWDYRFMDEWGYSSIFSVMFDAQGRVKHKFSAREPKDDDP